MLSAARNSSRLATDRLSANIYGGLDAGIDVGALVENALGGEELLANSAGARKEAPEPPSRNQLAT